MIIKQSASAGTEEAGDLIVTIEPASDGIDVQVDSIVFRQFGKSIERSAREVLAQFGVESCRLRIADKGALDYVIRARVETALRRAAKEVRT